MKALRTTLAAVILFVGAITVNAQSMSIAAMRSNARFLTDRMAYTLGINDPFLIDEIYRINYDYIWGVNEYLDDVALGYYYDDYMAVVAARDAALRNLLGVRLWNRIVNYSYFYRPIVFANHGWRFSIYDYDRYGVNRFYYHTPRPLVTYTGGHFFRGMTPRRDRMVAPPRDMGPRGGAVPRAGAPIPNNGAYRGAAPRPGRMNDMAPRMNGNMNNNVARPAAPNTNVNVNRNTNTNTNTNVNVNRNVNVNVTRPAAPSTTTPNTNIGANRHEIRTNANANTTTNAGSSMRSGSNINSSSRFNAPTRSSATTAPSTRSSAGVSVGTRSSAGASVGTRSSAGASMGTRSGGAAVGGRTGGGRR
jgi:hypothetical protein